MSRHLTYFVSDVHLGLQIAEPAKREARFVEFLRSINNDETASIYLLGDIWDFWYEYRDVIPKGFVRVFAALMDLMDAGIKVHFCTGNHDIWAYSYFRELGMDVFDQTRVVIIGGKRFCLGHGDGLGPVDIPYLIMRWAFRNPFLQRCFSLLHPRIAFHLGNYMSVTSRLAKNISYNFRGTDEPLYRWCLKFPGGADYFVFGHYHARVDMPVESGGRLLLLGDWITRPNWMVYDETTSTMTIK